MYILLVYCRTGADRRSRAELAAGDTQCANVIVHVTSRRRGESRWAGARRTPRQANAVRASGAGSARKRSPPLRARVLARTTVVDSIVDSSSDLKRPCPIWLWRGVRARHRWRHSPNGRIWRRAVHPRRRRRAMLRLCTSGRVPKRRRSDEARREGARELRRARLAVIGWEPRQTACRHQVRRDQIAGRRRRRPHERRP